VEIFRHYKLVV